jgi:uncharacterized membrane protein
MAKTRTTNPGREINQDRQRNDAQNEIISQQWSGPLPPPSALAQFNEIIPNGAERIMRMVELEQAHRIEHNNTGLNAKVKDTKRGQLIGGFIGTLSVGGCIFSAYMGAHPTVSIALVSVPILGIIRAFLNSRTRDE